MSTSDDAGETNWVLEREDVTAHLLRHKPRLTCADYAILCDAAAYELGIAFLPNCPHHVHSEGFC